MMSNAKLEIPKEEFMTRVEKVQSELQKMHLDGCLVFGNESEPQNVLYLSDYPTYWEIAAVFVPAVGEPTLVTGGEYEQIYRCR